MAQTKKVKRKKTTKDYIADIVVLFVSLLIIAGGVLAWNVYQNLPVRNDYDLASASLADANKEIKALIADAQKYLDNCEERLEDVNTCKELTTSIDSFTGEEAPKLSRVQSESTFKTQTIKVQQQAVEAGELLSRLESTVKVAEEKLTAHLTRVVGKEREQLYVTIKQAQGEISALQDVIDQTEGKVLDNSRRENGQKEIDETQKLITEALEITTENKDDYIAMEKSIAAHIEPLTNWINKVNLSHNAYNSSQGKGQKYTPTSGASVLE